MSVTPVTAYLDGKGRLHLSERAAKAADRAEHNFRAAMAWVDRDPPVHLAERLHIIDWLTRRAKDLPALAESLNPKETP